MRRTRVKATSEANARQRLTGPSRKHSWLGRWFFVLFLFFELCTACCSFQTKITWKYVNLHAWQDFPRNITGQRNRQVAAPDTTTNRNSTEELLSSRPQSSLKISAQIYWPLRTSPRNDLPNGVKIVNTRQIVTTDSRHRRESSTVNKKHRSELSDEVKRHLHTGCTSPTPDDLVPRKSHYKITHN